jgi:hypothetical protein
MPDLIGRSQRAGSLPVGVALVRLQSPVLYSLTLLQSADPVISARSGSGKQLPGCTMKRSPATRDKIGGSPGLKLNPETGA